MAGQQSVCLKSHHQPQIKKNLGLHGQPRKGSAKFHGPTSCRSKVADEDPARCAYEGRLRGRTGLGCRATSLRLPPFVHAAREGPSPKALGSSSLARPWPMPGPACPPWCGNALPGPNPTVGAPPLLIPSANSPLAAVGFGGAAELEAAIAPVPGAGLDVDLPCGLVLLSPAVWSLRPKSCRNNADCCSDYGIVLPKGGGLCRYCPPCPDKDSLTLCKQTQQNWPVIRKAIAHDHP